MDAAEEYERRQIRQKLWDDVEVARVAHMAATARLDQISHANPSAFPDAAEALRIRQTAQCFRSSVQHYMDALKRFADFTTAGAIPEDLRREKSMCAGVSERGSGELPV